MDKQPLTHSMRQWLLDQLETWRGQGLVTEEQANAILDLYETPKQSSARQQSIAIYVLLAVAALFVGLAMLLCIGYNWELLPWPIKLIIIFATVSGTYAAAFWLRFWKDAKLFSEIVFFLGALFYGGAISLVAQIFNLNAHWPDGIWWWAVGIIPIALCLETPLLHLLVSALLAIWIGAEILNFGRIGMWFFGRFPNFANGCYSLPVLAGLGLAWGYGKKSPVTVGLYVPLIAWWVFLQPFAWQWRENPIFFIGSMGALLMILAEAHEEGSKFAFPYRLYGVLLCMIILAILSFHEAQRDIARFDDVNYFFLQTVLVTALAGAAFFVSWYLNLRRAEGQPSYVQPMKAFAIRQWLPISMVILMFVMTCWHALFGSIDAGMRDAAFILPTILANAAMLGLAFWLMMLGLREDRGFPFTFGVIYFLSWAIMRYADLFGNFGGMLGASCMFFLCGAAIFTFAMYWHRHKHRPSGEGREAGDAEIPEAAPEPVRPRGGETGIQEKSP